MTHARLRPSAPHRERVPGPQVPGLVSGVVLVLGCWLVVLSLNGVYGAERGFDAPWNDRVVGLAAIVLGLLRATRGISLRAATTTGVTIGVWLLVAPLVVDYGFGADSTMATVIDVLAGAAIATLTVVGHLAARPE